MYKSEKNFLERIADTIPGFKGYREKESRRDTDKRLRDYMASEVDRHRKAIDGFKRDQMKRGGLGLLDDADRVARKLQKCADQLRFASYGYAGFFDQVKVREEELDQIYQYDGELLEQVRALEATVNALSGASDPEKALNGLEAAVEALDGSVERRKQLFQTPA